MIAHTLLCLILVLIALPSFAGTPVPATEMKPDTTATLDDMLEKLRQTYHLPAVAVAVVQGDRIAAIGAVGVRREGDSVRVTQDDRFHIGSCTKSMTATLAARLVDQKKITWKTTIGSVFPKIRMSQAYRNVTLEQLLKHRGGVPTDVPVLLWNKLWSLKTSPRQQRLSLLKEILSKPPAAKPGSKFIYSNAGYAIAGAMLEQMTGESWEVMMQRMLFAPLDMTTAGFGAPAKTSEPDQPLGHVVQENLITAIEPGPGDDNPPAVAPAGAVHCSIADLATYAMFHLHGTHNGRKMLNAKTFEKLHAPAGIANYAMGWIVVERDWAGGAALTHTGSNTMFVATIWIAPAKDFAVVIATNLGGDGAIQACDAVAGQLIQRYLPGSGRP